MAIVIERGAYGGAPVKDHYDLGVAPAQLRDPGDGGVIGAACDAFVALRSGNSGGETRTLGDPLYVGQVLDLIFETDLGDIVITADSAINQTGNTIATFQDGGDHLRLLGARDGSAGYAWRVLVSDFANGGLS